MIENLDPIQAWDLMQTSEKAVLIDVRTAVEHSFVGHPPRAIHVAWKEFPGMQLNTNFVAQVSQHVADKSAPVLLLCRSGVRSVEAAKALEAAGVKTVRSPADLGQAVAEVAGWKSTTTA